MVRRKKLHKSRMKSSNLTENQCFINDIEVISTNGRLVVLRSSPLPIYCTEEKNKSFKRSLWLVVKFNGRNKRSDLPSMSKIDMSNGVYYVLKKNTPFSSLMLPLCFSRNRCLTDGVPDYEKGLLNYYIHFSIPFRCLLVHIW